MKIAKFTALFLAMSLILSGCSATDKSDSEKKESSKIYSENIALAMQEPKTLNPITNTDEGVLNVLNLVYDGLFEINKNYNAIPKLVEESSMSSDGKSMTIKLKDAKWHDGTPVTSEDVSFTVSMIKSNASSPYNYMAKNISGVNVIDSKNLTVNFNKKNAFAEENLTFPIVSKNQLSGKDINSVAANKIGNGIYKIKSYNVRTGMQLEVNKEYYGEIPKDIKNVYVSIVPDSEAVVSMVEALESDMVKVDINDLSRFENSQFTIRKYQGRDYECLLMNQSNQLMSNVYFRQAISYAIDRDNILSAGYMGDITSVNIPINSTSNYYDSSVKPIGYDKNKVSELIGKIKIESKENIKETDVNASNKPNNNTGTSSGTSSGSNGNSSSQNNGGSSSGESEKPSTSPETGGEENSGGESSGSETPSEPSGGESSGAETQSRTSVYAKEVVQRTEPSKEETKDTTDAEKNNSEALNTENSGLTEKNNSNTKEKEKAKEPTYYTEAQLKSIISSNPLKIIVNREDSRRVKSANLIVEDLKAVGIKAEVVLLDASGMQKALTNKSYDMALTGWQLSSIPDITEIMKNMVPSDSKLNSYLAEIENASTEDEIRNIYSKIEKYCIDNALFISIGIKDNYMVTNNRFKMNMYLNDFDQYRGIENFIMK